MRRRVFCTIVVVTLAQAIVAWGASDDAPPAARWLPRDTVAMLEVSQPRAIFDLLLESKLTDAITNHPAYRHAMAQPGAQQAQTVVRLLEAQLGMEWKTALKALTGKGATVAVLSQGPGAVVVMIDAEDGAMLHKLFDTVVNFAKLEPNRVKSVEYAGVTCWELGDGRAQAVVGRRYISSNRLDALKTVLDLRAASAAQSLAASADYQAAKQAVGSEKVASALLNLKLLKQIPGVKRALSKNTNPIGALLFAGLIDSLQQSKWLALGLEIDDLKLVLEANLEGKPAEKAELVRFARPGKPDEGTLPNLSVPRQIAGLSFYRDLHGFYAAKDKLFPERTSGLIFFENMMGIFFSGRDLTDEILAEVRPEIRFVAAEQKYAAETGTPQIQVPGFALILKVRHPKEAGDLAEEAFQKAVGLYSFTSGQKGVPGFVVDRPTHADVRYTTAYSGRIRGEQSGPLPVRYNFRPSLAKLGDYVVISSTDGLACDLIDALKKEIAAPPKPMHDTDSLVEFNVPQFASLLTANRAALVRQNMMEKGTGAQEAETQVGLFLQAVKLLGKASLEVTERPEGLRTRIELNFDPHIGPTGK